MLFKPRNGFCLVLASTHLVAKTSQTTHFNTQKSPTFYYRTHVENFPLVRYQKRTGYSAGYPKRIGYNGTSNRSPQTTARYMAPMTKKQGTQPPLCALHSSARGGRERLFCFVKFRTVSSYSVESKSTVTVISPNPTVCVIICCSSNNCG